MSKALSFAFESISGENLSETSMEKFDYHHCWNFTEGSASTSTTHDELLQPATATGRSSTPAGLSAGGLRKGGISSAGVSAAGISTTARISSATVPSAGVSAALRTSVRSASASSTQFIGSWLLGRLFGCSLLLLPVGCVLLRRHYTRTNRIEVCFRIQLYENCF
ncbi:uncharacterized protein LOC133299174 [Gastrolobium bilobum]|uniref:uncharacterized protein LOC133299174 n=1 Tax=Gastrolobium bilobum TaxID=150636 RepID=UPI002AB3267E|nr:uncharacterized protein LOC133299174 [Gastrolobium bilobum]